MTILGFCKTFVIGSNLLGWVTARCRMDGAASGTIESCDELTNGERVTGSCLTIGVVISY